MKLMNPSGAWPTQRVQMRSPQLDGLGKALVESFACDTAGSVDPFESLLARIDLAAAAADAARK